MKLALAALLAACSSASSPPPSQPPPSQPPPSQPPAVMTEDECKAQGGRVNASIGGGNQTHCTDDELELGPVRFGIEGGWCCKLK